VSEFQAIAKRVSSLRIATPQQASALDHQRPMYFTTGFHLSGETPLQRSEVAILRFN
jgi:hypothetical protein